jgi:hypothetical protein
MSTRTAQFYSQPQKLTTRYLDLSYTYSRDLIKMTLKTNSTFINTKSFPKTYEILSQMVPSVLTSQCFNDLNLPFHEEVKATEMGHLLEHILLEYLCMEKLNHGSEEADFSGETSWNWIKDPHGTFLISIECTMDDFAYFIPALEKSIAVVEAILFSKIDAIAAHHAFQPTYPSVPTILS